MERDRWISGDAHLELIIYGLKVAPLSVEYSQCDERPLQWKFIGIGYATSLYLPYELGKGMVSLLSTLHPDNDILYRLSWFRHEIIPTKGSGFEGIAFTNDNAGHFFRDRYLWQNYDFVVYEANRQKCLKEMNECIDALNGYYRAEHQDEVENIEDEIDEHLTMESTEDLLRTPALHVDSFDELDYIISSDQNDIQYLTSSGKSIAEAVSKIELPEGIERLLIIVCPGVGYNPSTDEVQPLLNKLAGYPDRSIDVDFRLCPDTTETDLTEIRIITKTR